MKIKYTYLEFKYPNEPWRTFDYTADKIWADIQYDRMRVEHPAAEWRKEKR